MKLIPFSLTGLSVYPYKAREITNRLDEKYKTNNFYSIQYKLDKILEFGDIKNKTILDLGCGSIYSRLEWGDRIFEPWLSRALHDEGAKVIGVDLSGLDLEKFKHYYADLTEPDSLYFLKTHSVDLACAFSLFDCQKGKNKNMNLFYHLIPQLERIIKPEGQFIFETLCSGYRK